MKKNILIDLDMTITDLHSTFMSIWEKKYPKRKTIKIQDRKHFKITDEYPEKYKDDIKKIINEPSFFKNMIAIENAIECVKYLAKNHEVIICTSPIQTPGCHSAKWDWVLENLGEALAKSMVIVKDKTLIRGDYLIDDNHEISGIYKPSWKQIVYKQGYNSIITENCFCWEMGIDKLLEIIK